MSISPPPLLKVTWQQKRGRGYVGRRRVSCLIPQARQIPQPAIQPVAVTPFPVTAPLGWPVTLADLSLAWFCNGRRWMFPDASSARLRLRIFCTFGIIFLCPRGRSCRRWNGAACRFFFVKMWIRSAIFYELFLKIILIVLYSVTFGFYSILKLNSPKSWIFSIFIIITFGWFISDVMMD